MKKKIDLQNLSKDMSLLLNESMVEVREPFNEFISSLYEGNSNNIEWLFGKIASRNPFFSSLFLNCVYLAFVKKLIQKRYVFDELIVYSVLLKKILVGYFYVHGINVAVNCRRRSTKQRLREFFGPLFRLRHRIKDFSKSYISAFRRRAHTYRSDNPLTLLDNFVLKESFDRDVFNDRYYPGLHRYLSSSEKKYFYYLPTFAGVDRNDYKKFFKLMRDSSSNFLIKEDFLKLWDYIYAFIHPLRILKIKIRKSKFLGFDLWPLLKWELYDSIFDRTIFLSLLNYRFVKRLKEEKIKVRLLIDWFENQPIDRSLIYGFRKYFPETPIIGYQGYIFSPYFIINIVPTEAENVTGVLPHEVAVVGKGLIKVIKGFHPDLRVVESPAFRFNDVWRKKIFQPEKGKYNILVALPISLDKSEEILRIIISASGGKYEDLIFNVKSHPLLDEKVLREYCNFAFPKEFNFVYGDIHDWIEKASLLIGNASSVCVESLAMGIPVIVLEDHKRAFSQNPIPDSIDKEFWTICYTSDELAEAILHYMNVFQEQGLRFEKKAEYIRRNYFTQVERSAVRRFLKLDEAMR
jgi:hypothetical protein